MCCKEIAVSKNAIFMTFMSIHNHVGQSLILMMFLLLASGVEELFHFMAGWSIGHFHDSIDCL